MNLLKNYLRLFAILCTIPIEPKNSIHNMQNSISKVFSRSKQENIVHKEFKNVKTLELLGEQGNISIHTWKQTSTMIELKKTGSATQLAQTTINFLQHEELLQIKTICNDKKAIATVHINIIIPEQTAIKIATKIGNIFIKNLSGKIEAQTDNGNIDIVDGSSNATIHSKCGNITIQRENMINTENMTATTDQGNITLQVPQHINSNINAQTKNGKIYSDLLITLQPKTTKLTDAVYKQQKQELFGMIAKNTAVCTTSFINLETKHGTIKIKNYM